jgi:hypothetical protein
MNLGGRLLIFWTLNFMASVLVVSPSRSFVYAQAHTDHLLPDGSGFVSWERPLEFTRTYYVDNGNPKATDSNPGTRDLPFLTINRAAQVLQPGERALIMAGIYRERITPARGGTGPDKMISYEAAPGAKVVVKGSRLVKTGWKLPTTYLYLLPRRGPNKFQPRIYQRDMDELDFRGYNPFAIVNQRTLIGTVNAFMVHNAPWPKPEDLRPYLRRRGMIYVNGRRLTQVDSFADLAMEEGAFWCEENGLRAHMRLPGDADPAEHEVELVIQEQVLAPRERGLGYIRLKGITFEHAANPIPVPQRGMVSTNAGHHWIIEDCVFRHANGLALDIGLEDWRATFTPLVGYSIVRRNRIEDVGACGLAGFAVCETLIEYNLIENIGWQNIEINWESGGIKLHRARNCLLRGNVIRHLRYAEGIWLDYMNSNTRVTGNVIADLQETMHGGIHLEASLERNMLDHNVIWQVSKSKGGWAINPPIPPQIGGNCILTDESDDTVIAHNLLGHCQLAGVMTRTGENRIIESRRGGTARDNLVLNNILFHCGRGIDFSHKENHADGNLYTPGDERDDGESDPEGRGLNWVKTPEQLRLDLPAWQKYFGFDRNGAYAGMDIEVDVDALKMTWSVAGLIPEIKTDPRCARDFTGVQAGATRKPGPFLSVPATSTTISVDPRK